MNKKLLKSFAAAAMSVLAIACAKEQVGPVEGAMVEATFSVDVPGVIGTKAGEGTKATKLYYQVFDAEGAPVTGLPMQEKVINGSTTVNFQLIKDQTYNFVFWAQTAEAGYYTVTDLRTITANYEGKNSNDENFDAFFAVEKAITINGPITKTVTLKRPFAQINVATTGVLKAGETTVNVDFTGATSAVTVKDVPTVFSPLADELSSPVNALQFASAAIPEGNFAVTGSTETYKYLAVNYVFAPVDGTVYDVEAALKVAGKDVTVKVPSVPAKRNYRTNIYGNLLTTTADFNVVIDPGFETPDINVESVNVASVKAANEAFAAGKTNVTITAVEDDDPTDIVLPKTQDAVGIVIPATTKALKLVYAADAADTEKPKNVSIDAKGIASLTIETPASHVELNGTTYSTVTATTSDNTLVVGKDVTVENLVILGGSVEVYGKVVTLTNENNCAIKLWSVGDKESWKKAYDANAQTIELSADIKDFEEVIMIGRDLTIKGEGHEIWNTAARVIRITAKANVDFYDLKLVSKSNAANDKRCVSFDNTSSGSKVLFDNCSLSADYYCINLTTSSDQEITIRNATVAAGWAAINCFANNANFIIENSILKGINDKAESPWNNFATIVFDGNGLSKTPVSEQGSGNKMSIKNSTIFAHSESCNNQAWFSAQYGAQGNVVKVDGATKIIDTDGSDQTDNIVTGLNYVIDGKNEEQKYVSTNKIYINGSLWARTIYSQEDFAAEIATEGVSLVKLGAGVEYTLQNIVADGITIESEENAVINIPAAVKGKSATFRGVTLRSPNANYTGIQHAAAIKYENCVIEGQPFSYAETAVFEGCTFNQTSPDAYNIWTYGSKNITFNNCVFNCAGKGALVYKEHGTVWFKATFNDCKFIASAPVAEKAAIEIDSSLNPYEVYINNCTSEGFANGSKSGNSLWNNKKGDATNLKVVVNGVPQTLN